MLLKRSSRIKTSLLLIFLISVSLLSCKLFSVDPPQTSDSDDAEFGQMESELGSGEIGDSADSEQGPSVDPLLHPGWGGGEPLPCPSGRTLYHILYYHEYKMNLPDLTWREVISPPGQFFSIYVDENGYVTPGDDVDVSLYVYGQIISPESNECPITNYEGGYDLRADITGICEGWELKLRIIEQRINPTWTADCPSPHEIPLIGFTSAPEIEYEFLIGNEGDAHEIRPTAAGSGGIYIWLLVPADSPHRNSVGVP